MIQPLHLSRKLISVVISPSCNVLDSYKYEKRCTFVSNLNVPIISLFWRLKKHGLTVKRELFLKKRNKNKSALGKKMQNILFG
jgi:hypothetical protein